MSIDLADAAREKGIKYFLIAYTDLFGSQRAKLVPASAIAGMQRDGAGFAGFATWLDMSPADPDLFARPDPASLIQLPWKPEVGWQAGGGFPAQCTEEAGRPRGGAGPHHENRGGVRVLPDLARWHGDFRCRRHSGQALLRPAGADAPL
jgi:glutamine synthetase